MRRILTVSAIFATLTTAGCSPPHTTGSGLLGLQRSLDYGYNWKNPNSIFSHDVVWTSGLTYPEIPHLTTSDKEGYWNPDWGYKIEKTDGNSIGLSALWSVGTSYRELPHIVTSAEEGKWQPQVGYSLANDSNSPIGLVANWTAGSTDPAHPHIHASDTEGQWMHDAGYTWVNPSDPNNLDVVAVETQPDYATPIAHAGLRWCSEPPEDTENEGWMHWGVRQLCGIGAVATEQQ